MQLLTLNFGIQYTIRGGEKKRKKFLFEKNEIEIGL